jgi:hypothetical protein
MIAELNSVVGNRKTFWLVLGALAVVAAAVLWLAPAEQTLGTGISSVYVHVALTWTGMTGLATAAVLGLLAAVLGRPDLQEWAHTSAWIGLGAFAAGLIMSALAAGVNWGNVF